MDFYFGVKAGMGEFAPALISFGSTGTLATAPMTPKTPPKGFESLSWARSKTLEVIKLPIERPPIKILLGSGPSGN
jgi:hypothetical protein